MDEKQNIFIRGRIKNMLLGASGQNVYPEEIEDKLNSMPMVSESLVVQDGDKLVALVYPDQDEVVNFSQEELEAVMDQNRENLNAQLPAYSRISRIALRWLHPQNILLQCMDDLARYWHVWQHQAVCEGLFAHPAHRM